MGYVLGVDVGGTFTDLVSSEGEGRLSLFKTLSTPEAPEQGVLAGLKLAAGYYQLALNKFLRSVDCLFHGTTMATNAVLTGRTAKTGLLTTDGHRDILIWRTGERPRGTMFESHMDYPEPYVPRYLTLPVRERINSEGGIEIPLNEEDVRASIEQFKKWGVEAVAVCFLWSFANPVHEKRVAGIIEEEWPEVAVSLSSEVNPIMREYFRASSTCINVSLVTNYRKYVGALGNALERAGYTKEVLMTNSSGGMMTAEELETIPVYALNSGPSMGPIAGLALARGDGLGDNVLVCDMGGTSFDVSLASQGAAQSTMVSSIGVFDYSVPAVDLITIGAGGGSIAWVDPGGFVRVGPSSAGAVPGPACYMLGGEQPTVTDANIVLNNINPDFYLGGKMKIDAKLSERVIKEKIADRLGIAVAEAAAVIWASVNENMIAAMSDVSVKRGFDPRQYVMIAGGGASPLHAATLARELDIRQVLVPRIAAGLCAYGMLVSDIRWGKAQTCFTTSTNFDYEAVNNVLEGLEDEANAFLERANVSPENRRIEFSVGARYAFQIWETEVSMPWMRITPEVLPELVKLFHQTHETRWAFREEGQEVEFATWVVRATGLQPKVELQELPYAGQDASAAIKGKRKIYSLKERTFVESAIYDGDKLGHGNKVCGLAIIEEPTTTVLVPEDFMATVTAKGNYLLERR